MPGQSIEFNGVSVTVDGGPAAGDQFSVRAAAELDIFTAVERIANALELGASDDAGAARLSSELNRGLENLDQALTSLLDGRTRIGARRATVDSQIDANEGLRLISQSTLADIEELDLHRSG